MRTARPLALATATAAALTGLVALAPSAGAAHGALVVTGLTEAGSLVTFRANAPGTILSEVPVTGIDGKLVAIDYRPSNGLLYGVAVAQGSGTIVLIDAATGAATALEDGPSLPVSGHVSIDVNPVPDALRVVDSTGSNLRIPFGTLALNVDADLAYADGKGRPVVGGVGYLNNDNDPATGTMLLDVETSSDGLFLQNPPNAGLLSPRGPVPAQATPQATGLDIATSPLSGTNWAFLSTVVDGEDVFQEIDVTTGGPAAGPLGTPRAIGGSSPVQDIAIATGQAV